MSEKQEEFKYIDLTEGDIVEFSDHKPDSRFGVVTGGFGMSTKAMGSKIFGSFGATKEKAVENFKKSLAYKAAHRPKNGRLIEVDLFAEERDLPDDGYTHRQPCRIVGHVNPQTGEPEPPATPQK